MFLFIKLILFFVVLKWYEASAEDPLVIVEEGNPEEAAKLPNSHSAALAMGFVFLCVLLYCAYRFCKKKCGTETPPLTVNLDDARPNEVDNYIKEHQDYLAIFGKKREQRSNSCVCEFKTTPEKGMKERY